MSYLNIAPSEMGRRRNSLTYEHSSLDSEMPFRRRMFNCTAAVGEVAATSAPAQHCVQTLSARGVVPRISVGCLDLQDVL